MQTNQLTKKQLKELDSLFDLVSERQLKDFGNISASNKSDGSLITSCDLWSDKTIVNGLSSIAPKEGVLSEESAKSIDVKAKEEADASAEFANASPYPEPSELMDDVYWETDNPSERTSGGTMFFETV